MNVEEKYVCSYGVCAPQYRFFLSPNSNCVFLFRKDWVSVRLKALVKYFQTTGLMTHALYLTAHHGTFFKSYLMFSLALTATGQTVVGCPAVSGMHGGPAASSCVCTSSFRELKRKIGALILPLQFVLEQKLRKPLQNTPLQCS